MTELKSQRNRSALSRFRRRPRRPLYQRKNSFSHRICSNDRTAWFALWVCIFCWSPAAPSSRPLVFCSRECCIPSATATKTFVIVDAGMNDLMRPSLYGAMHPITRYQRDRLRIKRRNQRRVDIVGPVCETGDCFLRDWPLGPVRAGEVLAIWAAGAYGMSLASNYNGACRAPEILVARKKISADQAARNRQRFAPYRCSCLNRSDIRESSLLGFSPLQLAPQNFKIRFIRRLNQFQNFAAPLEIRTRSVACSGIPFCPSSVRNTDSVPADNFTSMIDVSLTTTGRSLSVCGQMGVMMNDSTEGCTIGPPAESE